MKTFAMRTVIAVVAILSFAPGVQAAVLVSLNRATFQAASMGSVLQVQNFDALAPGTVLTTLNGVSYSTSVGSALVTDEFLTSTGENGLGRTGLGYFNPDETATFSFATAITAFAIDINTFADANGAFVATLNTGDTANSIFETFPGRGTGQFIGFVSDTPFSRVTIGAASNFSYTLDTLIYGERAAVDAMVPEPEAWGLMIAGFAGVGTALRRRRVRVSFG